MDHWKKVRAPWVLKNREGERKQLLARPAAEPLSDTTGHLDQVSIPLPFPHPDLTPLTTNNLNNSNNS